MKYSGEKEIIMTDFDKFNEILKDVCKTEDSESLHFDDLDEYAEKRIIASVLKEKIESYIKKIDEGLKNGTDEVSAWENKEFSKVLELSYKKSSTIDPKIVDELTDEECRKGYTVTEKAIKLSGRKDLLDKYKSITESKVLTLKSLKD